MRTISIIVLSLLVLKFSYSQGVGVGTNNPNAAAALDVNSTSKGILFPRLTTAQRSAILNPPDGLFVYNTDCGWLECYNEKYRTWIGFGEGNERFRVFRVNINSNQSQKPILITHNSFGIDTTTCDTALIIVTIGKNAILKSDGNTLQNGSLNKRTKIIIINYGAVYGGGGLGGNGGYTSAVACGIAPQNGSRGYDAIRLIGNTETFEIHNYGILAGGGGGGAGGARGTVGQNGGGGGGGMGSDSEGGKGGWTRYMNTSGFCDNLGAKAEDGKPGYLTWVGTGGLGIGGGGKGGDGGEYGKPGQNTTQATGGLSGYSFYSNGGVNVTFTAYAGSTVLGPGYY